MELLRNITHGVTGIAQQAIDQKSLDKIIALDKQNTNATFVFVNESLGLEIKRNRVITLQPIGDDLRINFDDYLYDGHAGPLYIVLPESYAGPKEKFLVTASVASGFVSPSSATPNVIAHLSSAPDGEEWATW